MNEKIKGSLRIGQAFGIGIYIHWSFWLLIAYVLLNGNGFGFSSAFGSLAFVFLLFGMVVLHELGHSLAARHFGIGTRHITLLPIGGVAALEAKRMKPREEIIVALAGPAVNLVLALILAPLMFLSALWLPSANTLIVPLLIANLILALFNLLPAFPMDGGRVMRALLALKRGHYEATRLSAKIGQGFAIAFGLFGLFTGAFTLIILAVFLFLAASAERVQAFVQHRQETHDPVSGYRRIDENWELVDDGKTNQPKNDPWDNKVNISFGPRS